MGNRDTDAEELLTVDQLLRQRAIDKDQTPLLAYPKTPLGISDYEHFTGAHLNRLIDGVTKVFLEAGIQPVYEETAIALYSPSDLDYIITLFGLSRLGYTPFLLSPRLPASVVVSLLTKIVCSTFLHSPQNTALAQDVQSLLSSKLTILPIPNRSQYDSPSKALTPLFSRQNVNFRAEHTQNFAILHSSGSTGLPKPIHITHKKVYGYFGSAQRCTTFQSLPPYHGHGLNTRLSAIYVRKTIYSVNGHVPQTHKTLTKAITEAQPEVIWTVPYVLKLLAEGQDGIEALKAARIVSSTGSRTPDDLGDMLIETGVHLGCQLGATEVGTFLTSINRPREDKAWNYLRPPPHVIPYLLMKPLDGSDTLFEAILLDGHKTKSVSNSNDPPNSYHTSDLFIAHSSIPNAWKFIGRLDDRITLLNGEKVLPLPIEGRIRQESYVKEAVVFGIEREVPGLLLFRSENAQELSDDEFLDKVWPAVMSANENAAGFSQISKEMIAVVAENVDCPSTDKASIKRAQVYRDFASTIDEVYYRLESNNEGSLQLDVPDLETWIMETFKNLGIHVPDKQADFFAVGVDSLKAIQMRGLIIKSLALGGNASKCPSLVVYDCGNTENLARTLYGIRTGEYTRNESKNEVRDMEALIKKFTDFKKFSDVEEYSDFEKTNFDGESVVVLTGATGSLGSHLLAQLIMNPNVSKIYCLVRISQNESAVDRLTSALKERSLTLSLIKVTALGAELSEPDLKLSTSTICCLKMEVTHIIHCAWAVNFALPVQSFVPQLQGLGNLLSLSLSINKNWPARFLFCSSVGTAMATPMPAFIAEAPIPSLQHASLSGYAQSKVVGERIVEAAVREAGAHAMILRIGQIVPARSTGSQLWNENDAISLMVRSVTSISAIPDALGPKCQDIATWLEADILAKAIIEIGGVGVTKGDPSLGNSQLVFNLVHPRPFSWRNDFLPALKKAGLEFDVVTWEEWMKRLAASDKDPQKNPSRKLLTFWQRRGPAAGEKGDNEVRFETKCAEALSKALRNAERVVDGDMVKKLLEAWRKFW